MAVPFLAQKIIDAVADALLTNPSITILDVPEKAAVVFGKNVQAIQTAAGQVNQQRAYTKAEVDKAIISGWVIPVPDQIPGIIAREPDHNKYLVSQSYFSYGGTGIKWSPVDEAVTDRTFPTVDSVPTATDDLAFLCDFTGPKGQELSHAKTVFGQPLIAEPGVATVSSSLPLVLDGFNFARYQPEVDQSGNGHYYLPSSAYITSPSDNLESSRYVVKTSLQFKRTDVNGDRVGDLVSVFLYGGIPNGRALGGHANFYASLTVKIAGTIGTSTKQHELSLAVGRLVGSKPTYVLAKTTFDTDDSFISFSQLRFLASEQVCNVDFELDLTEYDPGAGLFVTRVNVAGLTLETDWRTTSTLSSPEPKSLLNFGLFRSATPAATRAGVQVFGNVGLRYFSVTTPEPFTGTNGTGVSTALPDPVVEEDAAIAEQEAVYQLFPQPGQPIPVYIIKNAAGYSIPIPYSRFDKYEFGYSASKDLKFKTYDSNGTLVTRDIYSPVGIICSRTGPINNTFCSSTVAQTTLASPEYKDSFGNPILNPGEPGILTIEQWRIDKAQLDALVAASKSSSNRNYRNFVVSDNSGNYSAEERAWLKSFANRVVSYTTSVLGKSSADPTPVVGNTTVNSSGRTVPLIRPAVVTETGTIPATAPPSLDYSTKDTGGNPHRVTGSGANVPPPVAATSSTGVPPFNPPIPANIQPPADQQPVYKTIEEQKEAFPALDNINPIYEAIINYSYTPSPTRFFPPR